VFAGAFVQLVIIITDKINCDIYIMYALKSIDIDGQILMIEINPIQIFSNKRQKCAKLSENTRLFIIPVTEN
jgi:hypothetical protein